MSEYDKEILCTRCFHREVCSLIEEFSDAQRAVDAVVVPLRENECVDLKKIPWIKPVELFCCHYSMACSESNGT